LLRNYLRGVYKFAFGTITSVFDNERKMENFNLDKKLENIQTNIKQEGLYFFQKKLKVLSFANLDFKFETIITEGNSPKPRTHHTATFN
jgi:hypothetical protein